jgi:NitT/TauT family transport system permease protein
MPDQPDAEVIDQEGDLLDSQSKRSMPAWIRKVFAFLLILVFLIVAWELYKVIWKELGWEAPVRPDNTSMPHVWDIVEAVFSPVNRAPGADMLGVILIRASVFTFREAIVGFFIGGTVGFFLAVAFDRSALLERGLMPYVVASQAVPLLAIAPMVVIWGAQFDLPRWSMVSVIAAYLTFFPVTINTLRGLRSPSATSVELMRSYGASKNEVLWKLKVPAALPYIFTALKISATASVIGAIIGELPAGLADGLGRALLNFNNTFITSPEKLYGSVLVSALLGIVFVSLIAITERIVLPPTRRVAG